MKINSLKSATAFILVTLTIFIFLQLGCAGNQAPKTLSHDEMVARGKYLVNVGGCNDCHSPKVFTAMGPDVDTTKVLSGHPAGSPPMNIDSNTLHPGYGYSCSPDLTAWLGPWGISYTANLTADSSTGIGAWSEEAFIKTFHTGKHLGLDGGRNILPPMPWQAIGKLTDEDLKSVFAYLRSLPVIKNKVPAPASPDEIRALSKAKSDKS